MPHVRGLTIWNNPKPTKEQHTMQQYIITTERRLAKKGDVFVDPNRRLYAADIDFEHIETAVVVGMAELVEKPEPPQRRLLATWYVTNGGSASFSYRKAGEDGYVAKDIARIDLFADGTHDVTVLIDQLDVNDLSKVRVGDVLVDRPEVNGWEYTVLAIGEKTFFVKSKSGEEFTVGKLGSLQRKPPKVKHQAKLFRQGASRGGSGIGWYFSATGTPLATFKFHEGGEITVDVEPAVVQP